jgi:histidyl-tRNA synthetase
VDALLVPVGSVPEEMIWKIARACREAGWRVRAESDRRRLGDSLGQASEDGIPYVIIAGEDEVLAGNVRIRDMSLRSEELVSIESLKRMVASRIEGGSSGEAKTAATET